MQTELSGKNYTFNIWQGEALDSKLIAMDTETSVVERPLIPELALTTASDGKSHVIIPNEKLEEFLLLHAKARFVFYNIAFDFWVIDKFLSSLPDGERSSPDSLNVLWEAADENRLHDYMLLDMLYRLAVNDYFPAPRNLGEASKIYAGLSINKEDPYRMRYGEILNKTLDEVERGFLDYAIKDTIATWIGFINLYTRAKHLAYQYGISSDKLKAHGLFTEAIQVKAAIALTKITNNGIHLDTSLSREMHREIEGEIWKVVGQLDAEYPALFKRKKKKRGQNPKDFVEGEMELTENNIPKISRTTLSEIFTGVAARLNSIDGIKLVVPKTDKGKISTSMPLWGDYIQLDDFLTKWEIWSDNTKAAQFFSKLDKEEIYPRYTIFVRTGRTSQKDPNCVDSITEVLTPSGWKQIGLAFGQTTEIMQINKDTLEMAFTKPEWIKTQSRVWVNIEGKDINMRVTPDHRCITLEGGEAKDILADNVTSKLPILKTGIYNPAREKDQIPLERRKIELIADIICNFEVKNKEISRKVWRGKLYMLKTYCYAHPYANFIISRNKEEQTATVKTSLDNISELTEICGADFTLGSWIFTLYLEESVILLEQLQSFKYHIKNPDCPWLDILYLLTNQAKPLMTEVKRSTEVLDQPEDAYCVTVPSGYFVARRAGKVFFTGNCQQIKKGRMREIIVPRKGYALVAADYSFIELRTLAYIMEKLFKKSVMADVIRSGKDPHSFTGGMLVNLEYDEFMSLKKEKPAYYDKWRQNAKACFSGDTELLTKNGWVRYDTYNGKDEIAQAYIDEGTWNNNPPSITFTTPIAFKSFENRDVLEVEDRNISICATTDHNILYMTNQKVVHVREFQNIKSPRYIFSSGKYINNPKLNDLETQVLAMIASDGSFLGTSGIRFGFSKERKITRCRELLTKLNIEIKESLGDGVTSFTIKDKSFRDKMLNYVSEEKDLAWHCLDTVNILVYLEEAKHWDGHIYDVSKGHRDRTIFTSCRKQTIEVMQAMAALSGVCSVYKNRLDPRGNRQLQHSLSYRLNDKPIWRPSWDRKALPKMKVYCVQVPEGNLVIRRNGKVCIVPNCNFGLPGGLSAPSLLNYAKNIYHIKDWTMETAVNFRNKLCNEIYPELGQYLQEDSMRIMCEALECNTEDAWELFEIQGERSPFILNCIKNVVKGEPVKRDGTRYQENFISRIWENLGKLNCNPSITQEINNRVSGLELLKKLFWTSTMTHTGRVRGKVSFTQNKNTKFQGPAADGAKMAGYKLVKEESKYGYRVINFVHDEFVFEVPDLGGYVSRPLCDRLLGTMCEEMGKITPGLPIAGEYVVGRSWNKKNPNMKFDGDKIYF